MTLRGELFVQHSAFLTTSSLRFWIACSFGTGEFTYFSANIASVSMNNLVSTGSSTVATRSVVERTIVITTASLAGVAQLVAATHPLAPALKVRPNDRPRRMGAIFYCNVMFY